MDENNKPNGSSGSLIGSIIVVLILVIGAIYLFSNQTVAPTDEPNESGAEMVAPGDDAGTTVASDEVSLDAEAQAIADETAQLDAELESLDQEANL